MKKNIFGVYVTVLFSIMMLNSIAQDTILQWNIGFYQEDITPEHPLPYWYTKIYRTSDDTIINNIIYKKIYCSNDSLFLDSSFTYILRTDSHKIYMYNYNHEDLLFDFTLNEGDTLHHPSCGDIIVDSVETIYLNGLNRKKMSVEIMGSGISDIWIENVGSVKHGFMSNCITGPPEPHLLCYKENDELLLQDTSFNTCFYQTGTSKINNVNFSSQCKIYPSLLTANTKVTIESNNLINRIKIFDLQGKIVYYKKLRSLNYKLDLNYLKNGFYLILVNDNIYKLLIAR